MTLTRRELKQYAYELRRTTPKFLKITLAKHYRSIKKLDINALLTLMLKTCGGDDYDGCFTTIGQYKFNITVALFKKKLKHLQEAVHGC